MGRRARRVKAALHVGTRRRPHVQRAASSPPPAAWRRIRGRRARTPPRRRVRQPGPSQGWHCKGRGGCLGGWRRNRVSVAPAAGRSAPPRRRRYSRRRSRVNGHLAASLQCHNGRERRRRRHAVRHLARAWRRGRQMCVHPPRRSPCAAQILQRRMRCGSPTRARRIASHTRSSHFPAQCGARVRCAARHERRWQRRGRAGRGGRGGRAGCRRGGAAAGCALPRGARPLRVRQEVSGASGWPAWLVPCRSCARGRRAVPAAAPLRAPNSRARRPFAPLQDRLHGG
jgi:hypothetical protein